MKKVSKAYKQAMNKMIRDHSYMIVTVGVISNEAQATARVSSKTSYLSDNKSLFKDNEVSNTYATLEQNVFKVDGSMIFPPMNTGYQQLVNNIACISENVGSGITIGFANAYDIKGLTITFGEYYPTKFKVVVNGVTHTYTTDTKTFTTDDSFNGASAITITPVTFVNGNNKRLRIESMLMGIGIVFQNEDIESASFTDSKSFISEELPQIDFNVTCFDQNKRFRVDDRNSFINYLETGQEISVSMGMELEDGTIEWLNMPLTYLSTWASNNNKVAFTSTDRFALLTGKYTLGNTIHSRTLYAEAESVLQDAGLQPDEYVISDVLKTITIVNPMPEVSHAEALQLIANAGRCILEQGEHGEIKLSPNFENIVQPTDVQVISDTHSFWSNPQNITRTDKSEYADLTENFFKTDGSMYFIPPKDMASVVDSGYVSEQVADANGNFYENIIKYPYANSNVTKNGLKFTDNGDGSIHVEGTATADTWFGFRNNGSDDKHPMWAENAPYKLGDILQADLFIKGDCNGTIGLTGGYKTTSSSSNQGYIFFRSHKVEMENGNTVFSVVKKQDIDPLTKTGMKITAYMYIKKDCVLDLDFAPTVTVRHSFGDLLVNPPYRAITRTVDNAFENNGITYTLLDDGGILVNGKTTDSESAYELISPYAQAERLTFETGHTYKLTEGREVTGFHNNPYLQWVRYNSDTAKYDYNLNTANGDKTYTHADDTLSTYGVRICVGKNQTVENVILYPKLIDVSDYDENETRPTHYVSGDKPKLALKLPAVYTYYSVDFKFAGNPPLEMVVKTYNGENLEDTVNVTELTNSYHLSYEFYDFDKMELEFPKGTPNNRIVLQEVFFNTLSDYELKVESMKENAIGTVEEKTQSVGVKVFTFQEGTDGQQPQAIDDNVFSIYKIGSTGANPTFGNQLISTQEHALLIAKWIANYYANNISYEVNYRGEPRIDAGDYIFLESEVLNNLQVEVESHTINFNGALSGTLSLRRAANLISD